MKRAPLRKTPLQRHTPLRTKSPWDTRPAKRKPAARVVSPSLPSEASGETAKFPKPFKKPTSRPKGGGARSALRGTWMRPSKRGTKHSRREREWGFMAFCHARGCELCLDADLRALLVVPPQCSGLLEFAHLSDKKRYDVGDIGACLHQSIHRGIDGKLGGKATWYVALERSGQHLIRTRLANRARRAWDELTTDQRADWDRLAAEQRRATRAA